MQGQQLQLPLGGHLEGTTIGHKGSGDVPLGNKQTQLYIIRILSLLFNKQQKISYSYSSTNHITLFNSNNTHLQPVNSTPEEKEHGRLGVVQLSLLE